ncbi:MAG: AraC family transcriptional regulator [Micavibrio sp.]|nr:MAG: AraC family transcriptional regulator [Micavibrio sp.]
MSIFFDISFILIEWLAITGLAQCLLIITYILLRLYNIRQAVLPVFYFLTLACAFCMQFALRLEDFEETIRLALWGGWALVPPFSYLLILQIATGQATRFKHYWVVILPLFVAIAVFGANNIGHVCESPSIRDCREIYEFLHLGSGIVGAVSLLLLFGHSHIFEEIKSRKQGGYERYWLVISLIVTNLGAIAINIYRAAQPELPTDSADALLVIIGLSFSYLATTMFFRIYPPALDLRSEDKKRKPANTGELSPAEYAIAEKIHELMTLDKLYHEQSFSRADLARELNISENALSAIINTAFDKSFPQLLNEHRVEDAKRMLENPEIPVQTVAFEVGFNSLPSFNRVFKTMTGLSPSAYRNQKLS